MHLHVCQILCIISACCNLLFAVQITCYCFTALLLYAALMKKQQIVKARGARSFAEALKAGMSARGLKLRGVATAADLTYESVRSYANGHMIPSVNAAKALATAIGLDQQEATKLAVDDKIRLKFGRTIAQFSGKNPELAPIELSWHLLSEEQKRVVIELVEFMVSQRHQRNLAVHTQNSPKPQTILIQYFGDYEVPSNTPVISNAKLEHAKKEYIPESPQEHL
jgi:transcriptional regulator with XRE-family HTH domain